MAILNEREFISVVEKTEPRQFAQIVSSATGDEERLLRTHFGPERFERLQALASNVTSSPIGNVILLPGILGSELHEGNETIWMDVWSIIKGDFDQLQVKADGSSVKDIQAPNMLKKYYGEMMTSLLQRWNVVAFPFDWRLDIRASAKLLKTKIDTTLRPTDRLTFAAHSMGGLVVRSFLQQFPDQWSRVDRFVMMGTPNFGSFAIPILYNGLNQVMKLVSILDQTYDMGQLLQFAKMFVGTYQMLPFIGKSSDAQKLMNPAVYSDLNPPQDRFDDAARFQTDVAAIHTDKTSYIAGYNQSTVDGIADWNKLQSSSGYHQTLAGDGTVPHSLGFVDGITNYFVEEEHSMLAANGQVITAVQDILANGTTTVLPTTIPTVRLASQLMLQTERIATDALQESRAHLLASIVKLQRTAHPDQISSSEAELRDIMFSGISKVLIKESARAAETQ
jgi:pimeloyl-ACP methyl ester carboxylesterase